MTTDLSFGFTIVKKGGVTPQRRYGTSGNNRGKKMTSKRYALWKY